MKDFKLSQTALKDLERPDTCPSRWKAQWLERKFKLDPSDAMIEGRYLEYLCLGCGAIEGEDVKDLPRGAGGKKLTTQIRIDEQAKIFLDRFNPESPNWIGFTIIERQPKLTFEQHEGTLDFKCIDRNGQRSIWDLKYCGNINGFAKYDWSNPTKMDLLQQVYYEWLEFQNSGEVLPTYVYVADSSPELKSKIWEVEITDYRRGEMVSRINSGWGTIKYYEDNDAWPFLPSETQCNSCGLKNSCIHKYETKLIEKIEY